MVGLILKKKKKPKLSGSVNFKLIFNPNNIRVNYFLIIISGVQKNPP